MMQLKEHAECGVGFVVSRKGVPSREILTSALKALCCVEHRGACAIDKKTSDGAGVMTEIPFELFGYPKGSIAVASIFTPAHSLRHERSLRVFEETFSFLGLRIVDYRDVPIDQSILGARGKESMPIMKHAIIERPAHIRTDSAFNQKLYHARQMLRTKQKQAGIIKEFYFTSLSTSTIVYKALTRSEDLPSFYRDLQRPEFKTRFALFHRRFSTNTTTTWDKAQPFRLMAHNGEINTISGNLSWAYSREQALGLPVDELLTHSQISDSGNLNEMAEALKYRSGIHFLGDIFAILIPPAGPVSSFYRLWSRAVEPWDGPALVAFCDGSSVGARLDRNGFRPARWCMTEDHLYVASEAGAFDVPQKLVLQKGTLKAGGGIAVDIKSGEISLEGTMRTKEDREVAFDTRLTQLVPHPVDDSTFDRQLLNVYRYTQEDLESILLPMITTGLTMRVRVACRRQQCSVSSERVKLAGVVSRVSEPPTRTDWALVAPKCLASF